MVKTHQEICDERARWICGDLLHEGDAESNLFICRLRALMNWKPSGFFLLPSSLSWGCLVAQFFWLPR